MSNIYIQEPPTSGKVLLKTTAGDIDVELWAREAPKTCRNFVQLCMEGYYNGTVFHRVIKGFIAQGGDPNGDGTGGESIYGEPFKDEFHSRLRFTRRGLIASANGGTKDDNASQFFFTLGEATELQNKHTIFGKVTGDTIFNMLKLEDADIDANERPLYPYKIVKTEVLLNPFDDIVPRQLIGRDKDGNEKSKKRKKEKGVKNFGLLSFGAEAEEDEEQNDIFVQKNAGKAKSTHDILDDPKLSKQTVQVTSAADHPEDRIEYAERDASDDDGMLEEKAEKIRAKLRGSKRKVASERESNTPPLEAKHTVNAAAATAPADDDSDSDEFTNELEKERRAKRKKEVDAIRDEIKALKKEYKNDRKTKDETIVEEEKSQKEPQNDMVVAYLSEQRKYSSINKDIPKKGDQRQQFTLQLLNKFKAKLENIKSTASESATSEAQASPKIDGNEDEELNSDTWLSHTLRFEEQGAIVAKDASTKKDDWYDVNDPRNPINRRKRGEDDKRHDRDRDHRSTRTSSSSSSRQRR